MMIGITCCMTTAGARGIAIVPFAVVAGMKDLRGFVAGSWSFPVGEETHYRIVEDYCIGEEGVAADVVAAAIVPSEEFDVGDDYAMPVSAGKEAVAVGHVYHL